MREVPELDVLPAMPIAMTLYGASNRSPGCECGSHHCYFLSPPSRTAFTQNLECSASHLRLPPCDDHLPLRDDPPQNALMLPLPRPSMSRSQRRFVPRRRRVDRSLRVESRIDPVLLDDVGISSFDQHICHTMPSPVLESHRTAQGRVQHPTRPQPCRNTVLTKQTTYHTSFHCLFPRAY